MEMTGHGKPREKGRALTLAGVRGNEGVRDSEEQWRRGLSIFVLRNIIRLTQLEANKFHADVSLYRYCEDIQSLIASRVKNLLLYSEYLQKAVPLLCM